MDKHQLLLDQLKAAEDTALGMYAKGAKITEIVQTIRRARAAVEFRIRAIAKLAPKPAAPPRRKAVKEEIIPASNN